ncbi:MAG TPA: hypothetical protein VNJ47_08910 [Nevskiales bacterium]|nr:hypothetical protein [Nevskiales bacterium]
MDEPITHLHTNHWVDAVSSLEAAQEYAGRVTSDERQWKWLVIAVHCSVQGFMALALEHGNGLLVMKEEITAKWLKAHEAGTAYPDPKMDYFLNLYEKVKSQDVCCYVGSKSFAATESHDYCMKKLNELRNGFIHFYPQSWSIAFSGLANVCLRCLDVAEFLAWESQTIIWREQELNDRAMASMKVTRSTLQAVHEILNSEENRGQSKISQAVCTPAVK